MRHSRIRNVAFRLTVAGLLAAGVLAGWPRTAPAGTDIIALTGATAPGTGGAAFGDFYSAVINSNSQVAIGSSLQLDATARSGLFRWEGGSTVCLARTGDSVYRCGSYATLGPYVASQMAPISLNSLGEVGFTDGTVNSGGLYIASAVYRANTGGASFVMGPGWPVPGDTLCTWIGTKPMSNGAGTMAFCASTENAPDALCRYGSSCTFLMPSGSSIPALPGHKFYQPDDPVINASGQLAVMARDMDAGSNTYMGIWRADTSGSPTLLAHTTQTAPWGGQFGWLSDPVIADNGRVAFAALSDVSHGILGSTGGALTVYARTGTPVAGGGSDTLDLFNNAFNWPMAINDAGQVGFAATTTNLPTTVGLYRANLAGQITTIAYPGSRFEGKYVTDCRDFGFTSGGTFAFVAALADTPGGAANDTGIFLTDGRETFSIARKGDLVDGSPITDLWFAGSAAGSACRSPMNDYGQVTYAARLADGRTAILLYTRPWLYYHSDGDGHWDTLSNWTCSLKPGPVHELTINPQVGQIITGPAAQTTVNSIVLGAQLGTTTLQLSGPGLTANNSFEIQSSGRVEQTAGVVSTMSLNNYGQYQLSGGILSGWNLFNYGTFTCTAGTLSPAYEFVNTGQATVGGVQNWSPGASFWASGGTSRFTTDAGGMLRQRNLVLHFGENGTPASLYLQVTQHIAALTVWGQNTATLSPGGDNVVFTNHLYFERDTAGACKGKIDLNDNAMAISQESVGQWTGNGYDGITGMVASGYHNGAWDGAGIASSTAAADPRHNHGLAVLTGTDRIFHTEQVIASDVLIQYGWNGDMNGDGTVDYLDYGLIDNAFLFNNQSPPPLTPHLGYANGDLNFDGVINYLDYGMIDDAFLAINAPPGATSASAVPEPTIGAAGILLLLTARRRTKP